MKFPCAGWLLLLALGFFGLRDTLLAQAPAARPPGLIIAARVVGHVEASLNGTVVTLQNKSAVSQLATVTTARSSSVTLIFSNGATVQLGANTSLIIEQFLADPAPPAADSANEPSVSNTQLRIVHGEIVGQVKHLNYGAGSSFRIETPVGAAGIRGTTFQVSFQILGNGLANFSIGVVEGDIGFVRGTVPVPLDVPAGQILNVSVSVQVNAQTGVATITAPPVFQSPVALPPATQAAIIQAAVDSAAAAATVTTTTAPTTTTTPGTPTTTTVPPPAPAPDPRTTPGDGLR